MPALSRRQLTVLALLTVVWGLNWPVMKIGVTGFPPLTFRALSLWLGLPVLALVLRAAGMPFAVPRAHWAALAWLALFNMVLWHVLIMLAIPQLSSGRAAILGYTMPIFSAVLGSAFFGQRLAPRAWGGVAAAALGVLLLLWYEFSQLGGRPLGVALMLAAAAFWALGTQMLRRSSLPVPTLTLAFWMMAVSTLALSLLAVGFERPAWHAPGTATWGAIAFNAVLAFGFAQPAWFFLVRGLPPVASTLSVMLIPVLGVFSGALWLGERLHWQDWAAMGLMVLAIASVLWPQRAPSPARAGARHGRDVTP
ncbi:EamA family transporter [Acidovorax sp. SRB_14]|uniref:DMT family transporter n=1 Tax=Acidovorax sp. SRB_14 TaxID=1962699 RepID=UPI0015638B02|nr:EamA family transporter [Acidovorax sp. SRB_14]NMM81509.1 EamA family transporter [Acidovorax sp. SRB_14]